MELLTDNMIEILAIVITVVLGLVLRGLAKWVHTTVDAIKTKADDKGQKIIGKDVSEVKELLELWALATMKNKFVDEEIKDKIKLTLEKYSDNKIEHETLEDYFKIKLNI